MGKEQAKIKIMVQLGQCKGKKPVRQMTGPLNAIRIIWIVII